MGGWQSTRNAGVSTPHLPHASGRFYQSPVPVTALTTFTLVANTKYAVPIYIPETKTYATLSIDVTTLAAAKNARLGIYRDSSGVPGALELDAGTVSVATTGVKSITITHSLPAGWYWLVMVSDGTPGVRAGANSAALPWLGFSSGSDTTLHIGWSVAFTYGALPDPFTGGGALMAANAPRLMLGV